MADAAEAVDTSTAQDSNINFSETSVNPDVDTSLPDSAKDEVTLALEAIDSGDESPSHSASEESPKQSDDSEAGNRDTESKDAKSKEADKPKASAWASFNKQKKEFELQRQQFSAEREELSKFKSVLENAKHDRLAALEVMGYKDVREFIQSIADDGGRITPERQKILELERKMAENERREEERKTQFEQQQAESARSAKLDEIHSKVVQKIQDEHADSLVGVAGSSQLIMQELDRLAGESGVMPEISDAIKNVQDMQEKRFAEILKNPRAQALAAQILKSSKIAIPSATSKKANIKTIGDNTSVGTRTDRKEYVPSKSGDAEVEEAIAWLKTMQGSRK